MARVFTSTDNHDYYCRGCGHPLPRGFRGQFHADCLKADKRRRTKEKRRLEREKFEAWLAFQRCNQCGAAIQFRNGTEVQQPNEVAEPPIGWTMEAHFPTLSKSGTKCA